MTPISRPPVLARALAMLCLRGDAREVIVGDLDQEFAEAIAAGRPAGAARRHYWRQALASVVAVRRDRRDAGSEDAALHQHGDRRHRPFRLFQGVSLDFRSVIRALRRSPGYASVAILSLAIGIGANTAVFSLVRQLLFVPLPVDHPEALRLVYWTPRSDAPLSISQLNSSGFRDASGRQYRSNYTYAEYLALKRALAGTADLCGYNFMRSATASLDGRPPVAANGMLVSGNYFATLRPPVELGRALADGDDQPGAPAVTVLGYGFWTRVFGGDRNVLGRVIRLNDAPVTIVGVTGSAYRSLSPGGFVPETDVTLTFAAQPAVTPEWANPGRPIFGEPTTYWVRALARTRDGAADGTLIDIVRTTLRQTMPDGGLTPAQTATVEPGVFPGVRGLDSLRTSYLQPLRMLSVVVGVVLFIACVNVAGLMLARGVARQRELAVRRAIGAPRWRLIRELLLESVLLSGAGGVAGVALALWAAPVLQSMVTSGLGTKGVGVALDWQLLAMTAVLACTAGVFAGLLPALRFSRSDGLLLKDRSSGSGAPKLLAGRALLALQIAVSLPLVVGAGLFLRTLHNFGNLDLGFNPRGLVLFAVDPTMHGRAPERAAQVFPRLLDRLERIPAVTSVTLIENMLISGSESDSTVVIDGREADFYLNSVSPHYLQTMGMTLISGRMIDAGDRAGAPRVAVINQTAAEHYFGPGSPIGRTFKLNQKDVEVIGVSADAKYDDLRNAIEPTALTSYQQRGRGAMYVAVRTEMPLSDARPAIETAVADVDPALLITGFRTQEDQIDDTIGKERVFTRLLAVFGGFALLLACIGLHGVTSYSVARRTSEIGIRLALGAQRSQVLWLVLRSVVVLAIVGLAIGLPVALIAGPAVRSLLFGLEPTDPLTIAGSAAVMFGVAVAAGLWPARRAARMEALSALRSE